MPREHRVRDLALFTDLYELTMAAVYHARQMNAPATFELFVRALPPSLGYLVVSGIESALERLERFSFDADGLEYLDSLEMFSDSFLSLLENLRFSGEVWAIPEGEVVFATEPLLRVTAPLVEAQLVETILLNAVGYETSVATRAARIATACEGRAFVDFAARRSDGLDLSGTMAHSYVMSFDDERDAFATFARAFPGRAVLLLDTYDTEEAARRLVDMAPDLRAENALPVGVRLDSGALGELSRSVRLLLDEAGLTDVRIFASGNLDEHRIAELVAQHAPIDAFGIGTHLVTSTEAPALDTAYKLVDDTGGAKMKLSAGKATLPGRKQVHRVTLDGRSAYDILALDDEPVRDANPLLEQVMAGGTRTRAPEPLTAASSRCREALSKLPGDVRALHPGPERYDVRVSAGLAALRDQLRRAHVSTTREE